MAPNFAAADIMKALKESGAITCDDVAWPGQRCYTYQLGPLFSRRFRKCRITKPRIMKAMQKEEEARTANLPTLHQWLKANLGRIRLNDEAFQAADGVKDPEHAHTLLNAIDGGAWWYVRDPFGRCHTNLTNLNRVLRRFLTVDGKPLISLDISCSQLIILGLKMISRPLPQILNSATASHSSTSFSASGAAGGGAANSRVVRRPIQKRLQKQLCGHPHTLNDVTFSDMEHAAKDHAKQRFLEDAVRGTLYDRIAKHTGRTRAEVKPWVLRAIYYDPRKWRNRNIAADCPILADVIDAYQKLYPGVYEYTLKVRERDHRKLARDIQRDESYVVFNMICNQIYKQRPEVFIGTIHDAIVCKREDAAFVRKVMEEQFAEVLKVHPLIKEKEL